MKDLALNFATALTSARGFSGLTQKEVADKTRLTQGYLSKIENGTRLPSWQALIILAKTYGMPVWQLVWLAEQGIQLTTDD